MVTLVLTSAPAARAQPGSRDASSARSVILHYTVSMDHPESHRYHVVLKATGFRGPVIDLRMPAWMPGYYQLLDYAKNLSGLRVVDERGQALPWEKTDHDAWRVSPGKARTLTVEYDLFANTQFAAQSWLDTTRGFISPAGLFLYPDGYLQNPVTLDIQLYPGWSSIATGLDPVPGERHRYYAPDFDILYDCPILMGNLESLPSFTVRGIPHYFIGYQLGDFDRERFVSELKKMVSAAVDLFGDIPYKHYTFLAIGSGRGGIEHLNSTTVPFSGKDLSTDAGRRRVLQFLAHEYFHNYNVKRIRPIALGPFDYQRPNRTNMLWVSEGLSVYYEYKLVQWAGLMSGEDLLRNFQRNIAAYENTSGHLYQSLAESSWDTWNDGPLGGKKDSTISFYDKGPAVGLLFDMAIRHATGNRRSLDDVMRMLYRKYYQQERRGFTDTEFRATCEAIAGRDLQELFDYVYTVKEPDYATYLAYGGLNVDLEPHMSKDGTHTGRAFAITLMPNPDTLQASIRKSWLGY
jgi:predicted metalloprotease with PDZ domain